MALRIRKQALHRPYKRASVEIISVDQFTKFARKIDKTKTERQHLRKLMESPSGSNVFNRYYVEISHELTWAFWLEKP